VTTLVAATKACYRNKTRRDGLGKMRTLGSRGLADLRTYRLNCNKVGFLSMFYFWWFMRVCDGGGNCWTGGVVALLGILGLEFALTFVMALVVF
jgi:hypothetical protein